MYFEKSILKQLMLRLQRKRIRIKKKKKTTKLYIREVLYSKIVIS